VRLVVALAGARQPREMIAMPTKTTTKRASATKTPHNGFTRLSDEELGVLVGKHLREHPETAPTMVYAAIRELGKGFDGTRVRKQFKALTTRPATKKVAIKK
jgi:hypothetical protein